MAKEEFHGKYEYLTGLSGGTVRNVLAGILTRYADPEGELGISDEGWKEIESYYKNGSPNESGVDLYARIADTNNPIICGQMWSSGIGHVTSSMEQKQHMLYRKLECHMQWKQSEL